jgi:hypothetical protein
MQIMETNDGWILSMDQGRVLRIEIDFRLGLLLGDGSEAVTLHIEVPCQFNDGGVDVELRPGEPSSLNPILPFFYAEVDSVTIQKTGRLSVEFRGGQRLHVDPNDAYEAWEIGWQDHFLMVCTPGGDVSVFQ